MSPRPLPPSRGAPSPLRRWTVPCLVPGATRRRFLPFNVSTSTVAPCSASTTVSGTSTSSWSPACLKTGDGETRVTTNRSPGGPPFAPGSPLPPMRTRLPSLTPAGTFTRRRLIVRRAPEPPQVGQGDSTIEPLPPQREQGCVIEKKPWPCDSTPRPWQTGQTTGDVPGLAPVPWQVSHAVVVGIASEDCAPSTASLKDSETSVSRSRPRCGRGRPPAPGPAPPPRP